MPPVSGETLLSWRLRRVGWWACSPLARVAVPTSVAAGGWVAGAHGELAAQLAQAGVGVAIGMAGWAGWAAGESLATWPHRRDRIIPLGWALRHELGYDDELPAVRFIHWDHNFGEAGTEIRIVLPRYWIGTDEQRRRLVRAVMEKGRFTDADISWHFVLDGRWSYLRVTPKERKVIPKLVRATDPDVVELLEASTPGHHLLAIGAGGDPVRGDLDGDAPHVGISMRTGKGKSNQIKGIVAQEMHLGASLVILDRKRRSLKCFKGLDGVTYCRDIAEIHHQLIALYHEADERNRLADELGDDEEPPWQRRLVVIEEQNTTIDELTDYWQSIREPSDPRVSPAVRALRALGNMGRQVNIHLLANFQKMTAQAAGGTVARDNFGLFILSGLKKSTWKMLVDDLPMPNVANKPRGRNWYVVDGEATEGQSILWTDRQAREWAASGISSKVRAGHPDAVSLGIRPARRAGSTVLGVVDGQGPNAGAERLYTIREASSDRGAGIVPETFQQLRGLRAGSDRDPEFPAHDQLRGQAKLYRAETLQRWSANREQAG